MMIVASHTVIVSPESQQMDALLDPDIVRGTTLRNRYRIYVLGDAS